MGKTRVRGDEKPLLDDNTVSLLPYGSLRPSMAFILEDDPKSNVSSALTVMCKQESPCIYTANLRDIFSR